jgi:N-methylhydantoinase B
MWLWWDPFRGGTHLPDITFVAPVFLLKKKRPDFFVASRAHHADVGGTFAGSMGLCSEIYQEGFRIPPVKLVRGGKMDRDLLALLLANVRTPREREGDLSAQIAACHTGEVRLREVCKRYGLPRVTRAAVGLLDYSEQMMQALLATLPVGSYEAEDFLDDDGAPVAGTTEVKESRPVRIAVKITVERKQKGNAVTVDFTGTDPQVAGSTNAVEAITHSACFYVFRCLLAEEVPATAGLMRAIRLIAPEGTVVNARPPAAVAGGNVETSQRIVDVLLRALARVLPERIPAASSGTMNNLTIGGIDPRTGEPFAYYETIAGGAGGSPQGSGASGIHTHMTNSLNTPAEALEYAYPFRVTRYGLRRGSGGAGKHNGGDGILREIEVLTDAQVTLLSERRRVSPYGIEGGAAGTVGRAAIVGPSQNERRIAAKATTKLKKEERIRVETPGGGGWGK